MPHKTDTTMTGAAGEHLVLSRLLQRGILAAPAPRGTSKVDVLVNFMDGRQPVLLQVKARQFGSDGGWHMSEKHEQISSPSIFYCFVNFEPTSPTVHVIPSSVVAEALRVDHQVWLETPGKLGQAHQPTKLRRLRPKMRGQDGDWMQTYLENWDLLGRAKVCRLQKVI
jgi:hypothetical protein